MYLHLGEGLGDPPRIPNPNLQRHCQTLRDMQGRYLDWINYLQRTRNANDPISKSLVDLGEKQFIRETDYENYVARCKQDAQPAPVPSLQPQPLSPELIHEIVRALTGIRWPPPPKPKDPTIPTSLRMR